MFKQLSRGVELSKAGEVVVSKQVWDHVKPHCAGTPFPAHICRTGEVKVTRVLPGHGLAPRPYPPLDPSLLADVRFSLAVRTYLTRCVLDKLEVGQGRWLGTYTRARVRACSQTNACLPCRADACVCMCSGNGAPTGAEGRAGA